MSLPTTVGGRLGLTGVDSFSSPGQLCSDNTPADSVLVNYFPMSQAFIRRRESATVSPNGFSPPDGSRGGFSCGNGVELLEVSLTLSPSSPLHRPPPSTEIFNWALFSRAFSPGPGSLSSLPLPALAGQTTAPNVGLPSQGQRSDLCASVLWSQQDLFCSVCSASYLWVGWNGDLQAFYRQNLKRLSVFF